MAKKRVYFFNRFFWPDNSATAQILTDLCQGLDKTDFSLTVVTSRLNYADPATLYPSQDSHSGINIRRLWSTRFGRGKVVGRFLDYLTVYLSFLGFILKELGPGDVAVFKTDPPLLSVLGAVGKFIKGFRSVAWCQDVFPEVALAEMALPAPVRWGFRLLVHVRDWSLHHTDQVVVLGKDMEAYISERGVRQSASRRISNWSIQDESPSGKAAELRHRWSIDEAAFVVGYSGNLGRAHDWRTILDAARQCREDPGIVFLVCGGGYGYLQLRESARKEGLDSIFRFQPYQALEDLADSLQVPDVHWFSLKARLNPFIFPSKFFGILQAGRPAIFVGKPGSEIASLIHEHQLGAAVPEGDADGLVRAVYRLKADPAIRRECGLRARQLWVARFRKSVEIQKWQALLDRSGPENPLMVT